MAQHEIEIILVRQLASYLRLPMLVVDPAGQQGDRFLGAAGIFWEVA